MPNHPAREVQSIGSLESLPPAWEPTADSRGDVKDKIFVCIRGQRHDGHEDAADALRRGAAAVVVQRDLGLPRQVLVPDTREALAFLAARCCLSVLPAPTAKPPRRTFYAGCCKAPGNGSAASAPTALPGAAMCGPIPIPLLRRWSCTARCGKWRRTALPPW